MCVASPCILTQVSPGSCWVTHGWSAVCLQLTGNLGQEFFLGTVVKIDCQLPSINLLLSFVTYSVKYSFSLTVPFTWFHLILCNTGLFLARQLSLPSAKYWNCAHSEFFPNLVLPCTVTSDFLVDWNKYARVLLDANKYGLEYTRTSHVFAMTLNTVNPATCCSTHVLIQGFAVQPFTACVKACTCLYTGHPVTITPTIWILLIPILIVRGWHFERTVLILRPSPLLVLSPVSNKLSHRRYSAGQRSLRHSRSFKVTNLVPVGSPYATSY